MQRVDVSEQNLGSSLQAWGSNESHVKEPNAV